MRPKNKSNFQDRTTLVSRIEHAFGMVPMPTSDQLIESTLDLDGLTAQKHFAGRVQSDINDITEIGGCSCEDLHSMTASGVQYYIQAYLRYIIGQRPYWELGVIIGFIDFVASPFSREVLSLFSAEQTGCLYDALFFVYEHSHEYDLKETDEHILKIPEILAGMRQKRDQVL